MALFIFHHAVAPGVQKNRFNLVTCLDNDTKLLRFLSLLSLLTRHLPIDKSRNWDTLIDRDPIHIV